MATKTHVMSQQEINSIIADIEKTIKERCGYLRPSWKPMIYLYTDALTRYSDLMYEFNEGNHATRILNAIKDCVGDILRLSQKLGVSSPYDEARLKPYGSEKNEKEAEEPDYLDSLTND